MLSNKHVLSSDVNITLSYPSDLPENTHIRMVDYMSWMKERDRQKKATITIEYKNINLSKFESDQYNIRSSSINNMFI
jgi:hypothetical protein